MTHTWNWVYLNYILLRSSCPNSIAYGATANVHDTQPCNNKYFCSWLCQLDSSADLHWNWWSSLMSVFGCSLAPSWLFWSWLNFLTRPGLDCYNWAIWALHSHNEGNEQQEGHGSLPSHQSCPCLLANAMCPSLESVWEGINHCCKVEGP